MWQKLLKRNKLNGVRHRNNTAYNIAVADFLNAPHINEIDVSHYTGQPDSYIQVRAVDDFETVSIQNSVGTEVESGSAVLQEGSIWWRYIATATNKSLEGDKIIVRVSDIPENLTEEERDI